MSNPVNRFCWDLFDIQHDDRVFLSPFGIFTAMSALAHGAPVGSVTSSEILKALHCDTLDDLDAFIGGTQPVSEKDEVFRSSNLILVDMGKSKEKGINPEYEAVVAELFGTKVDEVDFKKGSEKVRTMIKKWAKESTNGMIDNFESQVNSDTMAAILNAVAFKGRWYYPFEHEDSYTDVFHNADGTETDQRLMSTRIYGPMYYAEDDRFRAVKLSYYGGYYMFFVLPKGVDDLKVFEEWTSTPYEYREEFLSERNVDVGEIELVIPRFEMSCEYDLKKTLESIGVKISLSDAAEYTRIINDETLKIGSAKHQSRVRVDEVGTEAAAVTEIVMDGCTAMPPPPPVPKFVCDIPFIFSICSEDGTMLFTGYFGRSSGISKSDSKPKGKKKGMRDRIRETLDEFCEEL